MKNSQRKKEKYWLKRHKQAHPNCQACGCSPKVNTSYDGYGNTYQHLVHHDVHHLVPLSQGGSFADGLITLCGTCHREIHTVDGNFSWNHVNPELTEYYLSKL